MDRTANKIESIKRLCLERGYEFLSLEVVNKMPRIFYINHNKDRNGTEFGKHSQNYYDFIKGCKDTRENKDSYAKGNEWVKEMQKLYPEYDFSHTKYYNKETAVAIICKKHGEFTILPPALKHNDCEKCPKCFIEEKKKETRSRNIERLKSLLTPYGITFNENEYIDKTTKIPLRYKGEIIYRIPKNLYKGNNLEKVCELIDRRDKQTTILEKKQKNFIEKVTKVHPNLDFSEAIFNNTNEKVKVICHCRNEFGDEHGEFYMTPHNLLSGYGCKKCSNKFLDRELFIKKAEKIHNGKYDYSKVDYKNAATKVCIICPEHGEFWQIPGSHLNKRGCPLCKTSHLEKDINNFLSKKGICYEYQYHNKELLGRQSLDFYIPDKRIAIECQGEQHFISNFFKSKGIEFAENHLKYIQSLDKKKQEICEANNITLIYFTEARLKHFMKDLKCFTDKDELYKFLME